MKSQGPVHVLGPALAAAPSAARASSAQQMPAMARIVAATMLSFFVMAAPLPQTWTILTWKMAVARQSRHLEQIPIPCGARATLFQSQVELDAGRRYAADFAWSGFSVVIARESGR